MKKNYLMLFPFMLCMLAGGCVNNGNPTETPKPVVQESDLKDESSITPTVIPTVRPTEEPMPTKTAKPQNTPAPTKKASSQSKTDDDPYDAKDYAHPDDFYYDHYDDFWEYEEAEEYWEENQ